VMAAKRRASGNPFSALVTDAHSGTDSDDSQEDVAVAMSAGCGESAGLSGTALRAAPVQFTGAAIAPGQQAGGTVATRIDPLVGSLASDAGLGVSDSDIESCNKVVELLGKNPNLFKLPAFRKLRQALHPLIIEQMKANYESTGNAFKEAIGVMGGRGSKRRKMRGAGGAGDDAREAKLAALEQEYINQTQLRAIRMQQLETLNQQQDGVEVLRVPDGVALLTDASAGGPLRITASSSSSSSSSSSTTVPMSEKLAAAAATFEADDPDVAAILNGELRNPISCYICHKPYRRCACVHRAKLSACVRVLCDASVFVVSF
jgi:hypothetical protein